MTIILNVWNDVKKLREYKVHVNFSTFAMRCKMSAVVQTYKSMRKGTSKNINFLTLTYFNVHTVIADVGNVVTY